MTKLTRNLLLVFLVYLALLFIFGGVYYGLYRAQPDHFAFNADILVHQREVFTLASREESQKLQAWLDVLNKFREALDQGAYSVKQGLSETTFTLKSGERYSFGSFDKNGFLLQVAGPQGQKTVYVPLLTVKIPLGFKLPPTDSDFRQLITSMISQTQSDLAELLRRQATLSGPSPEVWSYWDFFYFSSISQTTVGYGDILPNSTVVRMLVVVQVLIGYALFVVVLNVVVNARHADSK